MMSASRKKTHEQNRFFYVYSTKLVLRKRPNVDFAEKLSLLNDKFLVAEGIRGDKNPIISDKKIFYRKITNKNFANRILST